MIINGAVGVVTGAASGIGRALSQELAKRGIATRSALPAELRAGVVVQADVGNDVDHMNFVTEAWTRDPLTNLLQRIPGFVRSLDAEP